jgi:GNAT superfamily N-acetyltransferase
MMHTIEVRDKNQIEAFRQLPYRIYANDSKWIPNLRQDVEAVFDKSQNKFWRHGKAERWILMDDSGQCIGRVAAFVNIKTSNTFKQPTGGMGFFECINNSKAAFILFYRCKSWLEERGMQAMDGPINFGEKDKFWGLIVENFNAAPYYGQNYNPSYYVDFFESYGFQVYYYQHIFYRKVIDPLQEKFKQRAERLLFDPAYTCRHIDKSNLEKYAEDFRIVYNRAWVTHDNFKGMHKEQALSIMKKLKPVLDERLIWFAYHNEKPIGFYISLPELNENFRSIGDNLNWFGKLKFLWFKWTKKRMNSFGVAFGIDPDYQAKGVEGYIFKHMEQIIQRKKLYEGIIITWIGDFNPKMIAIIKALGGKEIRKMATYRKVFDPVVPFERSPIISNDRAKLNK